MVVSGRQRGKVGLCIPGVNAPPYGWFTLSFIAVSSSPHSCQPAFKSLMISLLGLEGCVGKERLIGKHLTGEGHISVREHGEKKRT